MFKKNMRFISVILCFSCILLLIPMFANPAISSADSRIMGLWWWWPQDGNDATLREQYLDFFDDAGITEIYYYGYDDLSGSDQTRANLHTFITSANNRGMKVSILFDDKSICNEGSTLVSELKTNYLSYLEKYPNDKLCGYHFDIEQFSNYQDYCTYFIGGIQELRNAGILCSVDVNPTKWGSVSVSLNGITGMYNIIAANVDTMTLMSYRQNASKVVDCGTTCLNACKKYGTAIRYGFETANSGEDGVDFYGKTLNQLYTCMNTVYETISGYNLDIEYGLAVHQNRAFYVMEGTLPDKNATTTAKPTVIGGEIVGSVLYQNLNLDITESVSADSTLVITNEELSNALNKDFEDNGLINDSLGEYYKITLNIRGSGSAYAYPCMWDGTNGWDFWPKDSKLDYPNGSVISSTTKELISYVHSLYNAKAGQNGQFTSNEDGVCLYLEEYGRTLYITGLTVEVFRLVGGTVITDPTQTSSNESFDGLLGDANCDKNVDMKDVLTVRKIVANYTEGLVYNEELADVNQDDSVDMKDVLLIRKYIAGLIEKF